MVNISVVGCGHWGPNYIRVFGELPDSTVVEACDTDTSRLDQIGRRFPNLRMSTSIDEVVKNAGTDTVVIATPTVSHHELAKKCLLNGKHVLVEKPLALKVQQADELVALAKEKARVLMVGHTFLYNPAVRKMKEYIKNEDFGRVYYLHATRTHLGLIRPDVNAIWDLAPHDVSIFSYLLEAQPEQASAVGGRFLHDDKEDVGFITLTYPGGCIGSIHVSWIDSNKMREIVAVGSRKRIVFDDLNNLEKIRVYEKGASVERAYEGFGEFQLLLRDGDIVSPRLEFHEPLRVQCQHFLDCVMNGVKPLTDGREGSNVVRVMNAIEGSMRCDGAPVQIE